MWFTSLIPVGAERVTQIVIGSVQIKSNQIYWCIGSLKAGLHNHTK